MFGNRTVDANQAVTCVMQWIVVLRVVRAFMIRM